MGYYTYFDLSFEGDKAKEVEKYIEGLENSEYWEEEYLHDIWVGEADRATWYDHEDFMKKLSKRFPEVVFTLEGEGEENDDIWKKYFKDGKVQECRAKITFDEYDPTKLT